MKVDVQLAMPDTAPVVLIIHASIRELRMINDSLEGWNVPVGGLKEAIRKSIDQAMGCYQCAVINDQ